MAELDFDLFDASQTHNMWELMREFRQKAPVARIQGGFVYVSRYREARAVLRDAGTFSNAGGMRKPGVEIPIHDASIGELVPPVHGPVRKVALVAAQGTGVVKAARPFARETCETLIDAIIARGSGDLLSEYSLALTTRTIAWLLGVPMEDCEQLAEWGEEIMTSTLTVTNRTERGEGYAEAFPEFTAYLEKLIEDRIRNEDPSGNVVTRILHAGLEGGELTPAMIRMILQNLLLGGTGTTRDFIGNLLAEILQHPELHEQLHADRTLVPAALEESLRLSPPVIYLTRTCTKHTELAGVAIEPGERVVVGVASANRDEEVYEHAEEFRLDRVEPAAHLSFGFGPHLCLGSPLARVEGEEAIQVFLERFAPGQVRLVPGFELELMPLPYMLGPVRLDVEVVQT
ncbi:MAG: cytochrome P450 [Deltaproteobacteria bacterium]|nr:cytochrome P450 [Deltaproteobacteria bacterium]MBW2361235.1 cytochrome P450 [Deltaproteobacteria bacterium]